MAATLEAAGYEGDAPLSIDLLAGSDDVDSGEAATLTIENLNGLEAGFTISGTDLLVDLSHIAFRSQINGETHSITVTYDIVDAHGGRVAQSATVVVTGTNAPPVGFDEDLTINQNDIPVVDAANGVLANDTDPDHDVLEVSRVNGVALNAGAILTMNADGSYTFDTNHVYDGLAQFDSAFETFTYQITDGAETADATLTIEISGENDAPNAVDDTFTGESGVLIEGNLFANNGQGSDYDIDGDYASATAVNGGIFNGFGEFTLASGAVLTIRGDGSFSYDVSSVTRIEPGTEFVDSFTYTLTDQHGLEDTATATFHVTETQAALPITIDEHVIVYSSGSGNHGSIGFDGTPGYGGDGASGGRGGDGSGRTASFANHNHVTGFGNDTVTLSTVSFGNDGGDGGQGGLGGAGGSGAFAATEYREITGSEFRLSPISHQYVSVTIDQFYRYLQSACGVAGNNGAEGIGGTAVVRFEGNQIDAGRGNDVIRLAAEATAGNGQNALASAVFFNNTLDGGGGDDSFYLKTMLAGVLINITIDGNTFTGGTGYDTFDFSALQAPITLDLAAGTLGVGGGSNTISGFENFIGTAGADSLTGSDLAEQFQGGRGADVIDAAGGDDVVNYAGQDNDGAHDEAIGGAGTDTLRFSFTAAEWAALNAGATMLSNDIVNFRSFIANHTIAATGEADDNVFSFTAIDLDASGFETVQVLVDGIEIVVAATPVVLNVGDSQIIGGVTANGGNGANGINGAIPVALRDDAVGLDAGAGLSALAVYAAAPMSAMAAMTA